ncbi:MAG: hypothetical protein SPE18_10535 [Candidatus Limivicinus sp.]|nr:hypothetical protein [Candidatus Limivicinus sp.]
MYATKSTATYNVKVVFGDGIKQVGFGVNTTAVSNLANQDFTANVGADGYLYISIADYFDKYSYPVTASSGSSSWTVINANGTYNDHYISAPSSAGTRTVTLTATEYNTYYYNVHVFANGGKFSDGSSDYYTGVASSSTVSIEYSLVGLEKPTRAGYTFLGWGYSSNASQYYTDTITISATSQSSGNPTIYNIYAIWEAIEYNAYVKLGAGISSAMVQVDGVSKVDIRDSEYHRVVVNLTSAITIASIGLQSGYAPPYTVKFYASATATTPSSSLSSSDVTVSYDYTTSRVYAEITATKESIDLFYWNSASTDASLITAGQPISNMTAVRWNRFRAKIAELATAEGGSYSYSDVVKGDTFYASEFNAVRTAIMNRSGYGTLPAAQSSGNAVKASLFEGSGSLKTALNAAITHYNNS